MKLNQKLLPLLAVCVCLLLKPSSAKAASLVNTVQDQLILGSGSSYGTMTRAVADVDMFNPTYDYYLGDYYTAAVAGRSVKLLQPVSNYQGAYAGAVSLVAALATYQTQQVSNIVNPVTDAVVTQSPSMYNNFELYRTLTNKMLFAQEGEHTVIQPDIQVSNVLLENAAKALGQFGLVQETHVWGGHADMDTVVTAQEFQDSPYDRLITLVTRVTPDPPKPQPTPDGTPQGDGTPKPGGGDQPNIRTWEEKTHPIIIG